MVLQKPGYPLQSGDINEPHAITGIAQSIKEEADEFFETFEFPKEWCTQEGKKDLLCIGSPLVPFLGSPFLSPLFWIPFGFRSSLAWSPLA